MKGYMDKLLYVDLSQLKSEMRELDIEDAKKYMGGSGLAAKILYDETGKRTDPLGPENVLIFMTGPFAGTRALSSSRYVVVSKSPLTGLYGESTSGGSWREVLKRSGVDGIVIRGKASAPVYLWINNERVELRDAEHLWGKDTLETDRILKSQTDKRAVVACIGPAGEKRVPLAAIVNDGAHARTAARCGLGAVMGSKNLKAVVVSGDLQVHVHNPMELKKSIKELSKDVIEKTKALTVGGTGAAVASSESLGGLPIQNWRYTGRWRRSLRRRLPEAPCCNPMEPTITIAEGVLSAVEKT
jgi:aldehyde:ferredoxin oxidoreductase